MHCAFGFSRRAGGESDQGDIIRRRQHRLQTNGLVQSEAVELGIVVRRTVKPNDGLQPFALFSAGGHFIHEPRVAQGMCDFSLFDIFQKFAGTQQGHSINHNRTNFRRREPAGHHCRIVG